MRNWLLRLRSRILRRQINRIDLDRYTQQQILDAYRAVFVGPQGQIVLADMERELKLTSFVKGDPYSTAYNEGVKDHIRQILAAVEARKAIEVESNLGG